MRIRRQIVVILTYPENLLAGQGRFVRLMTC